MSNSALVTYTKLSPNCTHPRKQAIDTVTIHCIVGQWTAKQGCDYFASTARQASANYIVGKDGSIGLCVDEGDRAWTSGGKLTAGGMTGSQNDQRAITIEVASDTTHPYVITDKAMEALIELLADICRRNPGIGRLRWKGDKNLVGKTEQQNMTVHRWFAAKACPGDYLYNLHGEIAERVNAKLDEKEEPTVSEQKTTGVYKTLGDVPESYRPTIQKLMEKKALGGYSDPDPSRLDDNVLNISEDFCRVMAVLDRLGVFDK
ncbi:MAG: N-acetylmuramoyl-L-alanine amidase [Muribaculaceae bacterium]|nr:N-acetylmuramoyl-L-alanine amidase [Muribaculaceae bacterium]MCM1439315.1 N-acetylmuramoyl-L-alanine amidase [Roseburia sp.]